MDNFHIRAPATTHEWDAYYDLRWQLLRAPWNQPRGSERDEYEKDAYHVIAIDSTQKIIGVGRLHRISQTQSQIRYMAVQPPARQHGIGKSLLMALEEQAKRWGMQSIVLNAREQAIVFYQRCGYRSDKETTTLYGVIRHWRMSKQITP